MIQLPAISWMLFEVLPELMQAIVEEVRSSAPFQSYRKQERNVKEVVRNSCVYLLGNHQLVHVVGDPQAKMLIDLELSSRKHCEMFGQDCQDNQLPKR